MLDAILSFECDAHRRRIVKRCRHLHHEEKLRLRPHGHCAAITILVDQILGLVDRLVEQLLPDLGPEGFPRRHRNSNVPGLEQCETGWAGNERRTDAARRRESVSLYTMPCSDRLTRPSAWRGTGG